MDIEKKYLSLKNAIKEKKSLVIAFSGGVDSSLLALLGYEILKSQAIAVTIDSEVFPSSELENAKKVAKEIGISHKIIKHSDFSNKQFVENSKLRCYYCKKEELSVLKKFAAEKDFETIAYGANYSDLNDYRPGINAVKEEGFWLPFIEEKISKEEIRVIAKELNLSVWNKPSMACLASRIQYNDVITKEKLNMIENAEKFLNDYGFSQVRVRLHGNVARIEVLKDEITKLLKIEKEIIKKFKEIGFDFVTIDMEGYRTGSMNNIIVK